MQKKLIERLEEEKNTASKTFAKFEMQVDLGRVFGLEKAIEIVNQLAEEFAPDINVGCKNEELIEKINFAIEASNTNDNYMTGLRNGMRYCLALIDGKEPEFETCNQDSTKNNQGWIPVTERMPEDCDYRFYMCIVENHEEDLPMFCQYEEDYGFGFWQDFYDEHTLGFLDSEFRTNEELGYEKVIAWQPLPSPYKPEEKSEEPQTNFYSERFNRVI